MTSAESIPIRYALVEQSELVSNATAFQVLSESEYRLLRCFMALLHLPTSTDDLGVDRPPFAAAISRVQRLPDFRKVQTSKVPAHPLWDALSRTPLAILMMGDVAPVWLDDLAARRQIGVLTSSEGLFQALRALPGVHVGLLKGEEDLREAYRILGDLLLFASDGHFGEKVALFCQDLAKRDIFQTRMKLDFIPPFPLPSPDCGRPAAYLLNRLSNNVDQPMLLPNSPPNGATMFPSMLDWCVYGCGALALLEENESIPSHFGLDGDELETIRAALTSSEVGSQEKFEKLIELGRRMAGKTPVKRPFFVMPAPRHDLIKGKGPESVKVDVRTTKETGAAVKAVNDFIHSRRQVPTGADYARRAYRQAWKTLETEERLISCQAAWLSASSNSIPIQINPVPMVLRRALGDLNSALESNSRKIPQLFRSVEMILAKALPTGLLQHLGDGNSPVLFFSDLPFEWTMVDEWPVCLTRPVSRIPVCFSHWDVLNAALNRPAAVDTTKPDRVLVFLLIEERDPIRSHSDALVSVSNTLSQRYTYASPKNAQEFVSALKDVKPDVVVLDAHGGYSQSRDQLFIEVAGARVPLDDLLPDEQVPPVWILSACHTSVTGAMRGCFVRGLLSRGCVCVVATLSRVDAFVASMFVGRLLTDMFNPPKPGVYENFHQAFFAVQYTTALLYDPLVCCADSSLTSNCHS